MILRLNAIFLCLLAVIVATAQNADVISDYIRNYRGLAIQEMKRTGVPAAIKLAQGIHETMAGQSELVRKSNNHFGIKCKSGYTGPYVLHDDDAKNERFMKYENSEQSYIDHSDFLKGRERYAALFTLDPTDYKGWAYGLKNAGYATNPRYPQLIIGLIEKYDLEQYTLMALGREEMPADVKEYLARGSNKSNIEEIAKIEAVKYPDGEFRINDTRVVFVRKGTVFADLARQFNIPDRWIYSFNDFREPAAIATSDQLVYLQLKRMIGKGSYRVVREGENLYDIAQTEGIRLEALLKYNKLTKDASPVAGSKLYLQDPATAGHMAAN